MHAWKITFLLKSLLIGQFFYILLIKTSGRLYINKTILEYFIKKNIDVTSFASLNLNFDSEFANVDPNYILEISSNLEMKNADALFISCTALPVLSILGELEKKLKKPVLSSNQTLIWDTIRSIGYKSPIKGYGKLLEK